MDGIVRFRPSSLKIAYDEIIFVRSKEAEAKHSRPMSEICSPPTCAKFTNQSNLPIVKIGGD